MIQTNGVMSFFDAPIAPVKDDAGRLLRAATLLPSRTVDLAEVYRLVTADERLRQLTDRVRAAKDTNLAKRQCLPYVTPFGTFSRRRCGYLTAFSGMLPIDVDKLESAEEAEEMKQVLFHDPYLDTRLAFISPGGRGVKAFIRMPPFRPGQDEDPAAFAARYATDAMNYVRYLYNPHPDDPCRGVDFSGKDVVRACFLCHDKKALIRDEWLVMSD